MKIFKRSASSSNIWIMIYLTGLVSAVFFLLVVMLGLRRIKRDPDLDQLETLQDLIDLLPKYGQRPAIVAFEKDNLVEWSYAELAGQAAHLTGGLMNAGLNRGDQVALLAASRPEWVVVCLAVLKAGAVIVPIDVQSGDDTLHHIIKDSDARFLFTTKDQVKRLQRLGIEPEPRLVLLDTETDHEQSWQHLRQAAPDRIEDAVPVQPDDPAVLFYTSGTTGPPKGVPLSHGNLAFQLNTIVKAGIVSPTDRVLLPLPLHHVYPFTFGLFAPLTLGLPIILPYALTGPQIIRSLREGKITFIIGVPRLYRALVSGLEARAEAAGWFTARYFKAALRLSSWLQRWLALHSGKLLLYPLHRRFGPELKTVASGGSKLEADLAQKLEALGWQVATGYGLTETAPLLTLDLPGQACFGSAGQPIEGVEIRIDPSARPDTLEEDQVKDEQSREGEILVKGPNVFKGYRHLPDKNEEAFTDDGWFRTGDLGYFDDDGYLYITGRVATMIITESGEKVQPDEVEETYLKHPVIQEVGVLQKENKLVAVIVPEPGELCQANDDRIEQRVRQAVEAQNKQLSSYQRISDYAITRNALPRTRLGKIRRHLLAGIYDEAKQVGGIAGQAAGPIAIEEMSNEDQALLDNANARQVWDWLSARYPDQPLTPDISPQLDLGIDSLEWLNLTLEIRERAGVELDEAAIGRIETVRDLLQEVAEASEARAQPQVDPLEQPEEVLSEQQKEWLKPLGPVRSALARLLFGVNRLLMQCLFRLQVEGQEHIPRQGQFVLAPNHVSYLDPFAIAAALHYSQLRQTYWGGWTGVVASNPINRFFVRLGQAVPIDPKRAVISSLAFGAAVLKRQKNLILFPEGRRSTTGELQPFKAGIGLLLEKFQTPVLPVFIDGTNKALPPGQFLPRFKKITVTFGKPLSPADLEQEGEGEQPQHRIAQALHDHVAKLSNNNRHAPLKEERPSLVENWQN